MPKRAKAHRPAGAPVSKQRQKAYDAQRSGTEARRFLNRTAWRKLRLSVLAEEPLCQDCQERGDLAAATEVHHVLSREERPDLALVRENLRSLCERCHKRRTRAGE